VVTLTVTHLALLVLVALVAGTIDAVAGGGGLITFPALLVAGLPSHVALGTNKGQSVFGSFSSAIGFYRAGSLDRSLIPVMFPFGFVGALIGTALVARVSPAVLRPVVLVLLILVAIVLTVRRPTAKPPGTPSDIPPGRARWIAAVIAFVISAYDGFFGPGTGTFLIMAFVIFLHAPLTRASGDAKVANFASNLASVSLFAHKGLVVWSIALPMAAAQLVGGTLGAHLAVKGGETVVRRVVLLVVVALVAKLGWDLRVAAHS
jgi:uncharacterized membrane protein YfcA